MAKAVVAASVELELAAKVVERAKELGKPQSHVIQEALEAYFDRLYGCDHHHNYNCNRDGGRRGQGKVRR